MTKEEKIVVEYAIKCVADSRVVKGHVDVFLEPVIPLDTGNNPNPSMIISQGDQGMGLPSGMAQIIQQIPMQMQDMMSGPMQKHNRPDPRQILFIEDKIEFKARNWKYGDVIKVSFEKEKAE